MSIKSRIRKAALRFGVEINRFDPLQSSLARLVRQLTFNGVDLVVDIGANDGGYAKSLRDGGYGGRILSFEPLKDAHERLCRAASSDDNWLVAPRMALGEENGEAKINIAANSTSSSLLPMLASHREAAPHSVYTGIEEVIVSRLDAVQHAALQSASRIFLKVDVQGLEMAVLNGAENLLGRVVGAQIESSLVPLYDGQALYADLFEWMKQREFDVWGLIPGFTDPSSGRLLQMDGVFFSNNAGRERTEI